MDDSPTISLLHKAEVTLRPVCSSASYLNDPSSVFLKSLDVHKNPSRKFELESLKSILIQQPDLRIKIQCSGWAG